MPESKNFKGLQSLKHQEKLRNAKICKNEGIFVFPEILRDTDDITKDQMILQSVNNSLG